MTNSRRNRYWHSMRAFDVAQGLGPNDGFKRINRDGAAQAGTR
jgi:hypothetical protein